MKKDFFDYCYDEAIKLKIRFKLTEPREWDSLTTTLEAIVQVGHVYNVLYSNIESVKEVGRNINNIGDELSDVILQLSYLAYLEKVDINEIINNNEFNSNEIECFPILIGQLTEALMEENGYRFKKKRKNYDSTKDFVTDRINKLYNLLFNYCETNNIDIIEQFKLMLKDAHRFLDGFNA